MLTSTDFFPPPPPWTYVALESPRAEKRAALYIISDTASQVGEASLADLMACAAAASQAGFRIVTMASDDIDNPMGAPKLCYLMERLGQGEFDAIYGRAQGRDVVIELNAPVGVGEVRSAGRGLQ
jgi:hypothetical protein